MITKIRKRDGRLAEYDITKIENAIAKAMMDLRAFMFARVYRNPMAKSEEDKAEMLMETLYDYYYENTHLLPKEFLRLMDEKGEPRERIVCDYIGAMTDRFAIAKYGEIYIPKSWHG